jgi:hypothetical protein
VGSGFPALLIGKNSQDAIEAYRPFWNAQRVSPAAKHNYSPFWELEEFIEQGSALVGSPEQVLDKIHRFTDGFGQQLTGISVDARPFAWQREQLEWFAADIAPGLRRSFLTRCGLNLGEYTVTGESRSCWPAARSRRIPPNPRCARPSAVPRRGPPGERPRARTCPGTRTPPSNPLRAGRTR